MKRIGEKRMDKGRKERKKEMNEEREMGERKDEGK